MILIVGLGNPGSQYNFTRHNFGFLALDFYFKLHNLTWHDKPKFGAIWGQSSDFIFIKPQDFYNDSGKSIKAFVNYYKIPLENILVVCDDFNLDFGQIRYRSKGSAGGNNGLKSTITELGTDIFPRLRLGTGNDKVRNQLGDTDFVLGKFTPEEKEQLPQLLSSVSAKLDEILK